MKTVIKLLKKELREWKIEKRTVLRFYKYHYPDYKKHKKREINRADLHIKELEEAIEKLNTNIQRVC